MFLPSLALAAPTQPDNSKAIKNFWAKGYRAQWVSQTQAIDWEKDSTKNIFVPDTDEMFDVLPTQSVTIEANLKISVPKLGTTLQQIDRCV